MEARLPNALKKIIILSELSKFMQIFEFYFNPQKKERLINSFSYEPEKPSDKEGYLYMAGELLNVLSRSEQFLDNLAKTVKEEYYSDLYFSIDESIKKGLMRANDFLSSQISRNNVGWLGNLNFAIISLHDKKTINIAKIGSIKILLIRNGKITDVSREIDAKDNEAQRGFYSPKAFGRLTSGKLNKGSKIVILTKELFDTFEKNLILEKISAFSFFDKKSLENILDDQKKALLQASGVFFLLETEEEKEAKEEISEEQRPEFSMREIFRPLREKISLYFARLKEKLGRQTKKISTYKKDPEKTTPIAKRRYKRAARLTLFLAIILLFGSLMFQKDEDKKDRFDLDAIREEIIKADNFIEAKKNLEAFQALESLLVRIDFDKPDKEIIKMKKGVEERLSILSNLVLIEEPELVYQFSERDIVPWKILFNNGKIYAFTPLSNKIVELDLGTKETREFFLPTEKDRGAISAIVISGNPVFFARPNRLFVFKEKNLSLLADLKNPGAEYNFNYFSNFWTSVYFWDSKSEEILRYTEYNDRPELWLSPKTKKPTDIQSMSVDGSIWVIEGDGSVLRYFGGKLAEEINLMVFPRLGRVSHIFTSPTLNYIFFLDPEEKRIIAGDKKGNVAVQFKSQTFNNLIHFTVSENGKVIYLLNGTKIYRLEEPI